LKCEKTISKTQFEAAEEPAKAVTQAKKDASRETRKRHRA
jgi:hypothetical protein